MNLTDYELLYDLPSGEYSGAGLDGVRTVTIRAGRSLEVMCHPIVRISPEARREAKTRHSSPSMDRVNARNQQRHMMRLMEANFTPEAVVVTLTYEYPLPVDYGLCNLDELRDRYDRDKLPEDDADVKRDVRNFLSRLRRIVRAAGGNPKADFKWIQVIESGKQPAVWGLPPKYHIHGVIEGPGLNRDTVANAWGRGFIRADRFDIRGDGAARLARYFTKQRRGGRWWSHSRNLKKPAPRISDRKMSRRRMLRVAEDVRKAPEIFEKLYPGYRLMEQPEIRYSDYVAGCYIYARMRRRD